MGYYSGYFLLTFGRRPNGRRDGSALGTLATAGVGLMLVVTPVALLWKNFPQILELNGPTLPRFASALVEQLPKQAALVLTDDPQTAALVTLKLAPNAGNSPVLLDTGYLQHYAAYDVFLAGKYPSRWDDSVARTNQPDAPIPARSRTPFPAG